MTVPRGQPPEILAKDSLPYKMHADHFDDLRDRAAAVGWMHHSIRNEVLTGAGIVCDRPEGDERASASRTYFGRARNVLKQEEALPRDDRPEILQMQRTLVEDMLAVRYSIGDMVTEQPAADEAVVAFEAYQEIIRDLEQHLHDNNLPSLLPNLYLASSLYAQLRKEPAYARKEPSVIAMYNKLAVLCCNQTKHLHAVVTAMAQHNMDAESVAALDEAAGVRGVKIDDLCVQNPLLAETYVVALFKSGDHRRVVEIARDFFKFTDRPYLAEKYLRSLIALGDFDRIAELLTHHADSIPRRHAGTEKATVDVCVEAGWQLYGQGRYADIVNMVEGALHYHIDPKGNPDIIALYRQAVEELEDEQRLAAFKSRTSQ